MALYGEEEGGGEVRSSACPYLVHESSVSVTAVGRLRDGTGMRQRQCMLHLHVYVCARRSGHVLLLALSCCKSGARPCRGCVARWRVSAGGGRARARCAAGPWSGRRARVCTLSPTGRSGLAPSRPSEPTDGARNSHTSLGSCTKAFSRRPARARRPQPVAATLTDADRVRSVGLVHMLGCPQLPRAAPRALEHVRFSTGRPLELPVRASERASRDSVRIERSRSITTPFAAHAE